MSEGGVQSLYMPEFHSKEQTMHTKQDEELIVTLHLSVWADD